jgi:predicted aminopeptidase
VIGYRALLLLLAVLPLAGCETLAYYRQSVGGQLALMGHARPIDEVLDDPATTPALAQQLRRVQAMRRFAIERLDLPDNGSYRSYAAIGRRAVVWSVMATPPFDVAPKRWCYPMLGCLSYRGYFDPADARAKGERLGAQGMDVAVLPVPAYSTLGWFADPLPSTVIHWPEPQLAGLMFHELAHQRVYIPDDTAFNEAYANTVAKIGVGLWLADRPALLAAWRARQTRIDRVTRLLLAARAQLAAAFAAHGAADTLAQRKRAIYAQLAQDYQRLTAAWPRPRPYGYWFADGRINNAYLAQVATYDRWLPAFEQLWRDQHGDAGAFHRAVAALGALPAAARRQRLQALAQTALRGALNTVRAVPSVPGG